MTDIKLNLGIVFEQNASTLASALKKYHFYEWPKVRGSLNHVSYIPVTYPKPKMAPTLYCSGFDSPSLHSFSFNKTHLPALVLPSRLRMPFFCKSARSRSIVRLTTTLLPTFTFSFSSELLLCFFLKTIFTS